MIHDSFNFFLFAFAVVLIALCVFRYQQYVKSLPTPKPQNPIGF